MEPALSSTSFEIPAVFACRLAGKSVGISKLVDDKAGSILQTKNKKIFKHKILEKHDLECYKTKKISESWVSLLYSL